MRYVVACLAIAAVAAGCSPKPKEDAAGAGPSAASPMAALAGKPKPRQGLWESSMKMAGPQPMTVSSNICLDEAMLKDDAWLNGAKDGAAGACTQSFNGTAGGYAFQSTCKFGDRTVTSTGSASGDFDKAYTVTMVSKMSPVPEGMPAETTMTINANWLGPCPPGVAGGMVAGSAKMTPG